MAGVWTESGYDDFADGTFSNGGQNIYVSRAGVLQRIFHFDFNLDGYVDLLFVNSQDMNEQPPVYIYRHPFHNAAPLMLPATGAYAGTLADLNADGYDDLILGNHHTGTHTDLTAQIYYGSPQGLSERYAIELPAPNCRAVAAGDFNSNGRLDLAFACDGQLRLFFQSETGFVPGNFIDFNLEITHMVAGDLDGDGFADLFVRLRSRSPIILWGGPDGIDPNRYTPVGGKDLASDEIPASTPERMEVAQGWTPKILQLNNVLHVFRPEGNKACLFPIYKNRCIGPPVEFDCPNAVSAAVGNIRGNGCNDLVLAVCNNRTAQESSYAYWSTDGKFDNQRKTALPTVSARDVVIGDLDGDGCAEIVFCQGQTDVMHTTNSLVFFAAPDGISSEPVRLITHNATAAFIARTSDRKLPDLIFVNHEGGRVRGDVPAYIYYGGPTGFDQARRQKLPGWSAPSAVSCDFNDNGWPDILICNCAENAVHLDPGSFLYWGGPDGFDINKKQIIPTIRAHGCAGADFRRSGYLDLVIAGWANAELLVFLAGPDGFDLQNPQRIVMDPNLHNYRPTRHLSDEESRGIPLRDPRWLLAADFNNDGWLDIFVPQISGPQSFILWGGPNGFSRHSATFLNAEGAACAQAADLTGNGWLDLIIGTNRALSKRWTCESYVYIYWGGPEGFSEERRMQLPAHSCNSLAIADFNNDGLLDIFAGSYNAGRERDTNSYIYWGMPGGLYSPRNRTRLFTHSVSGCLAADFNEDGWIDLAVANHKTYGNHTGQSHVWWNGPDGFSENRRTSLPTLGPHGMLAVDPGNITNRSPEEYYVSSSFKLPDGTKVTKLRWNAQTPPKTWVKAQIRYAECEDLLDRSTWQGADGTDSWLENGQYIPSDHQRGRWIQYRLALGALNGCGTPRVKSMEVNYE